MILNHKVIEQLHQKWPHFIAFDHSSRDEAKSYRQAIDRLCQSSAEELNRQLSKIETPGAIPTPEFDLATNLSLGFPPQFNNHQEARDWACEVLLNHTTFAVDGSQIRHDPDFSIPVAAVQVAWFENHHLREGGYTKGVGFEILTPDELIIEFNGDRVYSEQTVSTRRFELEIETLCNLMRRLAAERRPFAQLPVALFDSSLAISFADRLQEETRRRHVEAMLRLMRCSKEVGIPVVGYVDTSYARDLTNLLAHCFRQPEASRVHDAQLVDDRLGWGARTPFFICARGGADPKRKGILESFEEYRRGIGFVYLKTNSAIPPARLEIPAWVYEEGLLDEVIDIVRAEVIVGNGYPYVIESADAAAVITARDREAFYTLFHRYAAEQGTVPRLSRKATSKQRRR
ncbi:MAG TPA: DNA double-strand break repair nuclease NurA [Blastocatellia bacterium]|nr:DNA double-strand break repair nuclease NurA [Blastocatellia bacterium]